MIYIRLKFDTTERHETSDSYVFLALFLLVACMLFSASFGLFFPPDVLGEKPHSFSFLIAIPSQPELIITMIMMIEFSFTPA